MVRKTLIPSSAAAAGSSMSAAAAAGSSMSAAAPSSTAKNIRKSTPSAAEPSKKARIISPILPRPLSAPGELDSALRHLRAADPNLGPIIESHEPPTFHHQDAPFLSLSRGILYQQLATRAAATIYARFLSLCGGEDSIVPTAVLALTPQQLRQIGISSRKASYLHDLAGKFHSGFLSDSAIAATDDESLFSMLTAVKGIGPWSVHMFLIFSLHRPDVLPVGDLGVRKGVQILHGLKKIPRPSEIELLCAPWQPYRSAGAWYMWRLAESKGKATMALA